MASAGSGATGSEEPAAKKQKSGDGFTANAAAASAAGNGVTQELHDVQLELQLLDERCADEQLKVQNRYDLQRRPHFEKRSTFIKKIPHFWQAAFLGHPEAPRLVHPAESDALGHIQDLDLRDNLDQSGSFEVRITFAENSLFKEPTLIKKVTFQDALNETVEAGCLTAVGSEGSKLLADLKGADRSSILGWFTSSAKCDIVGPADLGEILRRDLWQDPIPYYLAYPDVCPKTASLGAKPDPA